VKQGARRVRPEKQATVKVGSLTVEDALHLLKTGLVDALGPGKEGGDLSMVVHELLVGTHSVLSAGDGVGQALCRNLLVVVQAALLVSKVGWQFPVELVQETQVELTREMAVLRGLFLQHLQCRALENDVEKAFGEKLRNTGRK
ncbi:MAG: hypothetical protein BJ554DRAFT_605, partial [Olpidium bornovanus]